MISSIGTRIKELRKIKNISQEELANGLSVSRQTISKWESDIVSPDINNIEMISKFFEVSTDYIINGKENKTSTKQNNVWGIRLPCFHIIQKFQSHQKTLMILHILLFFD